MTQFMQAYTRWMAAKKQTTRHLQLITKLKRLPKTARVIRAIERSQTRIDKIVLLEDSSRRVATAISKSLVYVMHGVGGDDLADLKEIDQDEADIAKALRP